jgi:hypothetical protein
MAWGPSDKVTRASKTLAALPAGIGHIHISAAIATATPGPAHFAEGSALTLNVTFDEFQELLYHISRAEAQSNLAITNF